MKKLLILLFLILIIVPTNYDKRCASVSFGNFVYQVDMYRHGSEVDDCHLPKLSNSGRLMFPIFIDYPYIDLEWNWRFNPDCDALFVWGAPNERIYLLNLGEEYCFAHLLDAQ